MANERPGMMMYFDMLEGLLVLEDEKIGKFIRAITRYAMYGEIPQFDGLEAVLWSMIRPRLDRDAENYENKRLSGRYAAYCKNEQAAGRTAPDFETWKRSITTVSARVGSLPISTTPTTSPSSTNPSPTAAPSPFTEAEAKGTAKTEGVGGEKGEGRGITSSECSQRLTDDEFQASRQKNIDALRNYGTGL
jgi:hypothetical protein